MPEPKNELHEQAVSAIIDAGWGFDIRKRAWVHEQRTECGLLQYDTDGHVWIQPLDKQGNGFLHTRIVVK